MGIKDLIKKIGKLIVEIPWIKISTCKVNEEKEQEHFFIKSFLKVGREGTCDITIKNFACENISIERKGESYFLNKVSGETIELFDKDQVELADSRLKVTIGKFSAPLWIVLGIPALIFTISLIFSLSQNDILDQYRQCQPEPAKSSKNNSTEKPGNEKLPLPQAELPPVSENRIRTMESSKGISENDKNPPVKTGPTNALLSERVISRADKIDLKMEEAEKFFCKTQEDRSNDCAKTRIMLDYFDRGRKNLVSGEIAEARKELLESLKIAKELPSGKLRRARDAIELLISEIYFFEGEIDYGKGDFEGARERCLKALSYDSSSSKAVELNERLDVVARKIFLEGYVYEEVDIAKATASYKRVLKIAGLGTQYHSKALAKMRILDPHKITE